MIIAPNTMNAQQQAQREIYTRLHLVDVACHARHHGGCAERVKLRIGKAFDLFKQGVAQPPGKAHGGLCGKILCGDGGGKPHKAEQQKHAAHAQDVPAIRPGHARVDDGGHYERHKQLERSLQQLEQRPKHAFFGITLHINQKLFHYGVPLRSRIIFSHILAYLPAARKPCIMRGVSGAKYEKQNGTMRCTIWQLNREKQAKIPEFPNGVRGETIQAGNVTKNGALWSQQIRYYSYRY
jgi:hypothetical protein